MRKVYKVVRKENDQLVSASVHKRVAVTYTPGEWVSAEAGPILCFNRLSSAKLFASETLTATPTEIWSADAKDICKVHWVLADILGLTIENIILHWSDEPYGIYKVEAPTGTIAASSINLHTKIR